MDNNNKPKSQGFEDMLKKCDAIYQAVITHPRLTTIESAIPILNPLEDLHRALFEANERLCKDEGCEHHGTPHECRVVGFTMGGNAIAVITPKPPTEG